MDKIQALEYVLKLIAAKPDIFARISGPDSFERTAEGVIKMAEKIREYISN